TGYVNTPSQRVVVWTQQKQGGYKANMLPPTTFSFSSGKETAIGYGTAIDDAGDVSGNQIVDVPDASGSESPFYLGTVWLPSGKSVTLPGYKGSAQQTDARGMGASGTGASRKLTVVGSVYLNDGMWHPCTWQVSVKGSSLSAANPVLSK